MILSAELFEWMIGTIDFGAARPADNRRSGRVSMRGRLEVFILEKDDVQGPLDVGVRDASASGMLLEFEQPVAKGTRLLIRMPRNGEQALMLLCEIVHSRKQAEHFSAGVKFRQIVETNELPGKMQIQCVF